MTTQIAKPPPEAGTSWARREGGNVSKASCPLCGSELGRARVTTNTISLVECPACMGRGIFFWITAQAGDDAARLRAGGHAINTERVRRLLDLRAREGGPALVQQSDMDALLLG